MNDPKKIILHCSATPDRKEFDVEDIRRWHTQEKPKGNGWKDIGYHYVIRRDGTIQLGRLESEIGAHVRGENQDSIGICLVGTSTFTALQFSAFSRLFLDLNFRYGIAADQVFGHYEFTDKKSCPNIDMIPMRRKLESLII